MGEKSGTSVEDLRAKFDNLRIQKEETEKSDADKAAEEQKKFEDHEQVISADPRDFNTGNLIYWWPEDDQFWKRWGWKIAGPNLIWSTCNLFLMFAVFIHFGPLVNSMAKAHNQAYSMVGAPTEDREIYKFEEDYCKIPTDISCDGQKNWHLKVKLLVPLAAFSGASQRGVHCWMTAVCGGRVHNTWNTIITCLPMIIMSILLSVHDVNYVGPWMMVIYSGLAGGALSSCVNNISYFFPKRSQGVALGVVAGLGNIGEAFAYGFTPLLADVGICAAGASGVCDAKDFGGQYPFNLGIFWTILMVVIAVPSWLKLNSAPTHGFERIRSSINQWSNLIGYSWFWTFIIGVIWWLTETGIDDSMALLIIRIIGFSIVNFVLVQGSLYYICPMALKERVRPQMAIMRTRDIWIMSILCTASFGSLMAWCVAFPAVIGAVFVPKMPDPPSVDDFAWIGPFVAGLSRVLGGWLADKYGGSLITMWTLILLIVLTIILAVLVILAVDMDDPTGDFIPFILAAVGVFIFSGMSSGSVFRQIGFLYPPETRGPALGFVSCIASYAAALVIILLVQGILDDVHIVMFSIIVVLYIPVVVVNWWFYKRAASVNQC